MQPVVKKMRFHFALWYRRFLRKAKHVLRQHNLMQKPKFLRELKALGVIDGTQRVVLHFQSCMGMGDFRFRGEGTILYGDARIDIVLQNCQRDDDGEWRSVQNFTISMVEGHTFVRSEGGMVSISSPVAGILVYIYPVGTALASIN